MSTPTPWYTDGKALRMLLRGADGTIVAVRHRHPEAIHVSNFKLIVEAVNERDAIRAENARLTQERDSAVKELEEARALFFKALKERPVAPHPIDQLSNLNREMLRDAEKECAQLREALRPFADYADHLDDIGLPDTSVVGCFPNYPESKLNVGNCRVARAALKEALHDAG